MIKKIKNLKNEPKTDNNEQPDNTAQSSPTDS